MKQCFFSYHPTFIYLHICDSVEDIENENLSLNQLLK